jgi:hypothetical protein
MWVWVLAYMLADDEELSYGIFSSKEKALEEYKSLPEAEQDETLWKQKGPGTLTLDKNDPDMDAMILYAVKVDDPYAVYKS